MSRHDPKVTLRQLVEHCDRVIGLRNSMTWEEFRDDWRKQVPGGRLVEAVKQSEFLRLFALFCGKPNPR